MDDYDLALKYTLRLISSKDYLEQTIREKLKQRKYSANIIDQVIERLQELKYLDNTEYVKAFIEEKIRKKDGPSKIKFKLKSLGIDDEIISEHLDEIYTEELITENIAYWIERKYEEHEDKQKFLNFCRNKGFRIDMVLTALKDKDN